jgi:hypothetical protein
MFPKHPDVKTIEIILEHKLKLKKMDVPFSKLVSLVSNYGLGALVPGEKLQCKKVIIHCDSYQYVN